MPYLLMQTYSEDEYLETPDLAIIELTDEVLRELKKKIEIFGTISADNEAVIVGFADHNITFYRDLYDMMEDYEPLISLENNLIQAENNCIIVDKIPDWLSKTYGEAPGDWYDSPRFDVDDSTFRWCAFFIKSGRSFSTKGIYHEVLENIQIQKFDELLKPEI